MPHDFSQSRPAERLDRTCNVKLGGVLFNYHLRESSDVEKANLASALLILNSVHQVRVPEGASGRIILDMTIHNGPCVKVVQKS